MDKRFYVYEHRRASDGVVFYVGKGTGPRVKKSTNRNPHWKNIVAKHGFTAHKVYDNLSEAEAFRLEVNLISAYGADNLCNMTGGGDGMKSPSDEVRARLSRIQKNRWCIPEYRKNIVAKKTGQKQSAETIASRSKAMSGRVRTKEHCDNLSAALRGLPKSADHRSKISDFMKGRVPAEKNPAFDRRIRFFTSDAAAFIGTAYHFAKTNDLKRHNVDNLIRGLCKVHSGWSYEGLM